MDAYRWHVNKMSHTDVLGKNKNKQKGITNARWTLGVCFTLIPIRMVTLIPIGMVTLIPIGMLTLIPMGMVPLTSIEMVFERRK